MCPDVALRQHTNPASCHGPASPRGSDTVGTLIITYDNISGVQ